MFCCSGDASKEVYQLRSKHTQRVETRALSDMQGQRYPNHLQILKISRSDYRQLVELYKAGREMWQDQEFPPNVDSLGQIPGVNFHEWKRLSSIIKNPVLFDGRIQPQDVIQGSLGDCYFLSAVSALAQKEERIKSIFGEQTFNRNGIYRVTLRIGGVIQEIVVDDYVPVNKNGEPIFCQPNKNEFWVPILEKAWAKVNGSYANIIGSPIELFKAATYAPAETIETTTSKQQRQLLWQTILKNARRDSPCCCGTSDSQSIRWTNINLVPGHAYTLIDAAELEDFDGNLIRMLKLRNPWGNTEWQGEGCESDLKFWARISKTKQTYQFLQNSTINDDGIFFINFRDYCKYFVQTHISYMEENSNYISQSFSPLKKRGSYWSLNVTEEHEYCIELHQGSNRSGDKELSRATIVLAKSNGQSFEYVAGILSHYEEDITLRAKLTSGKYTIFTKLDLQEGQNPTNFERVSISIYSLPYVVLSAVDRTLCGNMLQEVFLWQARQLKRKKLQNDTMWISWKLMFKQGGYAYIAFGVEKTATNKFHISFNESDFSSGSFKLKKPFKGKGEGQQLEVRPGEERIILARVANKTVQKLKFPPPIQWKVVPLQS